jgi:ParB family chromosome partitioning protein
MSSRRGAWMSRRGQSGAELAIDQIIDRQPQLGEHIQQLADDLIEDSPYQARQSFSDASVEDLAQGMREAGFQGVLIVRPHSDPTKRRRGIVQLVYGHRRRIAWRRVCAESSEPCLLPTVVREIIDTQLLTIGAQENLQRQDLDPIEEAQIVAWHERMFFDKNQAEIGTMLGKSSDWVSVRSRIHKLPEALKDRLRVRPRAIGQMLELATLYGQQPSEALALADRVVQENLTVATVRTFVREAQNGAHTTRSDRDNEHNRRVGATSVQNITNDQISAPSPTSISPATGGYHRIAKYTDERNDNSDPSADYGVPLEPVANHFPSTDTPADDVSSASRDLLLLQQAAALLANVASRANALPNSPSTDQAIDQVEQSLTRLRQARANYDHASHGLSTVIPSDDT